MTSDRSFPELRRLRLSLIIGASLLCGLPLQAQVQITRQDVHHDISPTLSEMAASKAGTAGKPFETAPHEAEKLRLIPMPGGFKPPSEPDTVLQRTTAAPQALAPTVINNFDGLGQGIAGFSVQFAPPDTNGAVGLTQYVQWVNVAFAVFDKSTTAIVLGPSPGNTLWTGFGGDCETSNDGDPIVVYDKLADRWVFSQFVVHGGSGPFLQCVAVSTTSDATGSYNRYSFSYPNFDDYPKMGVWPDAYYVTFNMFGPSPFPFLGADVCAYDRNAMLGGQPATQICFQQGASVGSLLPSDLDGHTPPPSGSPDFLLNFGANSLNLFKFHVDFATPANSTFTGPTVIPVAAFTPLCNGGAGCVPQLGNPTRLDSLADRLMYRLAYRNLGDHESLLANHSVAVNTSSGVRWYEIQNPNGTPVVAQQSTFAPDSSFRWMGSIAMDVSGDIALGYSVSSATIFPSIAFTGRLAADPAGTMSAETSVIAGTGSQNFNLTRWGDYSAMQVDPVDDCTFWYTTEYLKNSGSFNWNTRIASFKFPGCGLPDLAVTNTHSGDFTQNQKGAVYTITVSNAGGKTTDGTTVTVTDTLPAKITAKTATGTGWTCVLAATVSCTRSDALAPGASYPAITLTVDVAADAPGTVTNSVIVAGGGDTNPSNDTAVDPTIVIQQGPDLSLVKSHTGSFFFGQSGTYTMTVTNAGLSPTDGTTVTVTDTLPAGLSLNTATGSGWTCAPGPPVSCSRNDVLASGAAFPPITLSVQVASNAPATVVNTAMVAGGGDINTLNNSSSDSTAIAPPPPDLAIAKSHLGNFTQSQSNATYAITVSNQGVGATTGVVKVTDTLPTGLNLFFLTGFGWNCDTLTISCTRSDVLAPGASYPAITVSVNVAANAPASVVNTASVSGGGDISPGNNTASDPTTINPAPDLTVALSHAPNPFVVGQTGVYTMVVRNAGQGATSGTVTVTDLLPFGFTATTVSGTGWTCSGTTFLSCSRADALAAGGAYPVISATVSVAGGSPSVTNVVTVSGGGEFNTTNDNASDLTTVNGPTLSITKTHAGNFTVGQPGTYIITVGNTGLSSTFGIVTVNDALPFGITASSATGPGWTCSLQPVTSPTCTRSDALAPNSSYPAITLTVALGNVSPSVSNFASVTGGGDPEFHSVIDSATVNAPILNITKHHVGDFTLGQPGVYTITVSNAGTVATVGMVTMSDLLPFSLTGTAVSGAGWTCSQLPATQMTCTRSDSLAPGASYPVLTFTVSIDFASGNVSNFATVTGGGDAVTHFVSDATNISAPVLSITKSHTGSFTVGQSGSYTITVGNVGTAATIGTVTLTDFLPFGLIATAVSGAGWNCPGLPLTLLTCTRSDSLAGGASYPALALTVSVAGGGASVTNTATVTGGGDSGIHSAVDPTIVNAPILAVSKSHTGAFTEGQQGTYSIVVSNTGTAATSGTVTLSDFLPNGMTVASTGGAGWSCSGTTFLTCTRADSLAPSASYPTLTLTVNVGPIGSSVTNSVSVTGGGDTATHTAFDATTINTPSLSITASHSPEPMTTGQPGVITIVIGNVGTAATSSTVTVADNFPAGMTPTSISGTGWSCSGTIVSTCTRSDALPAGSSYPPITINVLASTSRGNASNRVTASGGGDATTHFVEDTMSLQSPALTVSKSHVGSFPMAQPGVYNITVASTGIVATVGKVTVNDQLPVGLTATAVTGTGWACNLLTTTNAVCTRSDSLPSGASYPPVSVTVVPDSTAQASVTNQVSVNGGGDPFGSFAQDPTTIILPDLAITVSHTGDFSVGQTATYTITVANVGTVTTGSGTITVSEVIPAGLTAISASGAAWTCTIQGPPTVMNCAHPAGGLAPGTSYPAITLTVNPGVNAATFVTNTASISGVNDSNTANNTASDVTHITGYLFVPVAPCRIADTRNAIGPFGGPFLSANSTRNFNLPASACNVPATAQAYSLNFTVVPHGQLGFLTVFPCGQPVPLASLLNSIDGRVKAGAAIVPAGASGGVCTFANNDTDLIIDINGYFVPAADPAGLAFYPVAPCRLIDTRLPNGPLGGPSMVAAAARSFPLLSSSCAVPPAAQSYSLNFTVVPSGTLGFLTTWPTGQNQPLVSTLNAIGGAVTANAAIVPAGTNGNISVFVTDKTELIVDIDGYFAPPGPGGLSFYPATPCRVRDTRNPAGTPPFNGKIDVSMVGSLCPIRASAQSYVLNATVVPPALLGFITLWPQGAPQPLVSTLNALDAAITSNMAIVPTTNGAISVFASNPTHLVLDISGFFAP